MLNKQILKLKISIRGLYSIATLEYYWRKQEDTTPKIVVKT